MPNASHSRAGLLSLAAVLGGGSSPAAAAVPSVAGDTAFATSISHGTLEKLCVVEGGRARNPVRL